MLGKIEGRSRRDQQRIRWVDGITKSTDMRLSKFGETVKDREACLLQFMVSQRLNTTSKLNNNIYQILSTLI